MLLGESYYLLKLGTAGAFEKQTVCVCVCVCVCVVNISLEAEAQPGRPLVAGLGVALL